GRSMDQSPHGRYEAVCCGRPHIVSVSGLAKEAFSIAISDTFCDIARQLMQPATDPLHAGNQVVPTGSSPGVSAHHKAVWVLEKDRPPGRIELAIKRYIEAQRELDPEVNGLFQEPSDGGCRCRHPGMRPQDTHLRVQVQEFFDCIPVHMGV